MLNGFSVLVVLKRGHMKPYSLKPSLKSEKKFPVEIYFQISWIHWKITKFDGKFETVVPLNQAQGSITFRAHPTGFPSRWSFLRVHITTSAGIFVSTVNWEMPIGYPLWWQRYGMDSHNIFPDNSATIFEFFACTIISSVRSIVWSNIRIDFPISNHIFSATSIIQCKITWTVHLLVR